MIWKIIVGLAIDAVIAMWFEKTISYHDNDEWDTRTWNVIALMIFWPFLLIYMLFVMIYFKFFNKE